MTSTITNVSNGPDGPTAPGRDAVVPSACVSAVLCPNFTHSCEDFSDVAPAGSRLYRRLLIGRPPPTDTTANRIWLRPSRTKSWRLCLETKEPKQVPSALFGVICGKGSTESCAFWILILNPVKKLRRPH